MKNKFFIAFLSVFFLFGLTACSNDKAKDTASSSSSSSTSSSSAKSLSSKASSTSKNSLSRARSTKGNSADFALMIKTAQSQIPALKAQLNGENDTFKDIAIDEGEDSTIIYTYTFSQPQNINLDNEALKQVLIPEVEPLLNRAKAIAPDVKVLVKYDNPDGSNLATISVTQADIEAAKATTQE
ncbi:MULTISPECIES: hypothetical protein [Ligilactobacillus]|uniref:Hydrogenase accessory protein HypB, hypB n=1 Tax=Ligilactobacillus animalis TaxID=1605 RepID=A0ABR4RP06_9LACO|nr:hypothetical protein [Ligilactobacillus animalis]KDA45804.1 hydrogenase accessory protein HypB, hypB [Ligilactobacillus animalis]MBU5279780.1 hypothetical protein [Ligilactobacillus animalis]MDO5883583.1 hypothetical protein [Ligilactobacillus animalis]MDU8987099.1 hypothetical protein [Ligilactobacillus animalis]MEE0261006.1 hypothetical protein [Ligilactobacillus animalis]